MSVYLRIDNCLECPWMRRKGFFDTSYHCEKAKQELPYVTKYVPGAGRTPGAHIKTPIGMIPNWCPLAKDITDPLAGRVTFCITGPSVHTERLRWRNENDRTERKIEAGVDAQASACCELLVCPFCGGEPELDTSRYYRPIVGDTVHKSVSIYCTGDSGCPVEMMFCYADFPDFTVEQLTDLAKEFWNKRAH